MTMTHFTIRWMVQGDEFDEEDTPPLQILPLGASLGAEVFTLLFRKERNLLEVDFFNEGVECWFVSRAEQGPTQNLANGLYRASCSCVQASQVSLELFFKLLLQWHPNQALVRSCLIVGIRPWHPHSRSPSPSYGATLNRIRLARGHENCLEWYFHAWSKACHSYDH